MIIMFIFHVSLFICFTNNADIYDINEDKINNVKTLPVCYEFIIQML